MIIDENTEYFNHVSGLCICGKCKCGKHVCIHGRVNAKPKMPKLPMNSSLYVKDFRAFPVNAAKNEQRDFYKTFKSNAPMDVKSVF